MADRRKATRAVAKAQRALAGDTDGDDDAQARLVEAQADLYYTVNFPMDHKYLALFPSAPDGDAAAPELRQRLREHLRDRIRDGSIANPDAFVPGGDLGLRHLLNDVRPTAVRLAAKPTAGGAKPSSAAVKPAVTAAPAAPSKPAAGGKPTKAPKPAAVVIAAPAPTVHEHDGPLEAAVPSAQTQEPGRKRARSVPVQEAPSTAATTAAEADDDFFASAPIPKTARIKEYRVDDGGHRPELSSRRAWLQQQRCARTAAPAAGERERERDPAGCAACVDANGRWAPRRRRRRGATR